MSWASIIPAVAGVATSLIGANAANKAAQQQTNAMRQAMTFAQSGNDAARADLEPYRAGGVADYNALRNAVGQTYETSPGYDFARAEGIRAIDQSASARGMLNSGGRLRELMRYGTGVAQQDYNNWLSRLQGLAGVGQSATGQTASLAQQQGLTQAQMAQQMGTMQGTGTIGQANAMLGGINNAAGLWALMRPNSRGW
jgi:hypothetical protein